MGTVDKRGVVTMQELLVSSLAQTDVLTKLLFEKGLITEAEFMQKLSAETVGIRRCCGADVGNGRLWELAGFIF